jgi:lipid-A-disaccharide synthase
MSDNKSIFISAGDPSADFPGKNLIDEIRRPCPDLEIFGLGGPMMQKAGLRPLVEHEKLAVMGFWEILPKFFFFRNLLNRIADEIKAKKPRVLILIDYPGFNLRLASRIKPLGIPIVYYISPQVWAWGKKRLDDIKRLIDLMLVIFPFEEEFYRGRGINARFTGHPIVDRFQAVPDKATCRQTLGLDADKKLIALLPGSRLQEVKRMLPTMTDAAIMIKEKLDNCMFITARVEDIDQSQYSNIIGDRDIPLIAGRTPELISAADFVITSSGTATIETAYFQTPMIVIYKTGFFTYQIARRLVTLDSIGMVNIVAGRRTVPELIQHKAAPAAIASHVSEIMTNEDLYIRMVEDLKSVRDKLGTGGAGRRAADAIQEAFPLC